MKLHVRLALELLVAIVLTFVVIFTLPGELEVPGITLLFIFLSAASVALIELISLVLAKGKS